MIEGRKHVATKIRKTKYIIVFYGKYKQSVYLVSYLLILNRRKLVTYFKSQDDR